MLRSSLIFILALNFIGCSTSVLHHYTNESYKYVRHEDYELAPLLLQYKFVSPLQTHEVLIIDDQNQRHFVKIQNPIEASTGYIVNLPAGRAYALASFYMITDNARKELQLGKNLPLFQVSKDKLTRVRGFDIINDNDDEVMTVSIAPWEIAADNQVAIQAAKKFQVPEKSVRTIDIFKK